MICIYCDGDTKVTNSRHQKRTNNVWRRRHCQACGAIFTSIEEFDPGKSILVQKKDRLEPFSREKLLLSVYDSLRHRKTALEDATALTDTICAKLYRLSTDAIIKRPDIISVTTVALRRFDKVAVTTYLAFHHL